MGQNLNEAFDSVTIYCLKMRIKQATVTKIFECFHNNGRTIVGEFFYVLQFLTLDR